MYQPDFDPIAAQPAVPPVRPDLRVVAARRMPRRAFPRAWAITLVGLTVTVLVMYVHTVVQEAHLNRLKTDIDTLREQTVKARMSLERERNPQVVDRKAQGIGMKLPSEVVYLNRPVRLKPARPDAVPLPQAVTHEGF